MGVPLGLELDAREGSPFLLGLDDAGGLAVHVEEVVGEAVTRLSGELADGDTPTGTKVDRRRPGPSSPPPPAWRRWRRGLRLRGSWSQPAFLAERGPYTYVRDSERSGRSVRARCETTITGKGLKDDFPAVHRGETRRRRFY